MLEEITASNQKLSKSGLLLSPREVAMKIAKDRVKKAMEWRGWM